MSNSFSLLNAAFDTRHKLIQIDDRKISMLSLGATGLVKTKYFLDFGRLSNRMVISLFDSSRIECFNSNKRINCHNQQAPTKIEPRELHGVVFREFRSYLISNLFIIFVEKLAAILFLSIETCFSSTPSLKYLNQIYNKT